MIIICVSNYYPPSLILPNIPSTQILALYPSFIYCLISHISESIGHLVLLVRSL